MYWRNYQTMRKNLIGPSAIIWSQAGCTACAQAKSFLELRGYSVAERYIDGHLWGIEDLHKEFPGVRSVPQVTVDGQNVGGLDSLKEFFDKV